MDRLEYQRAYRAANRERLSKQRRQHYANNREDLLAGKKTQYAAKAEETKRKKKEYYARNRDRISLEKRKQRLENPGPSREALWRRAGITLGYSEFLRMVEKQNGKCAICPKVKGIELRVDHCHATGKIRGLLCDDCNIGIGKLGDTLEAVRNAFEYLKAAQQ